VNVVWYLIIAYYHGGVVAIPQQSRRACLDAREWVITNNELTAPGFTPSAYCVAGVGK
jgi:hypothetical protein